jgi:hypothetical protein
LRQAGDFTSMVNVGLMGMEKPLSGPRPNALSYARSASSRTEGVGSACRPDRVAIVSRRPTQTFKDGPLRDSFRQMYHAYACIGASLTPCGLSRAPTTKDFAEERRPDSFIHDYRYVRYVTADAELTLPPTAKPAEAPVRDTSE